MGVYIRGIEMPKDRPQLLWVYPNGKALIVQSDVDPWKELQAVPIPTPHGRLVDADARVTVQLYDDQFEDFQTVNMSIDDLLDSSWLELEDDPTVIQAEEAEE